MNSNPSQPTPASIEEAVLARRIAGAPPGEARDAESELYRRLAPRVRIYGLRHLRDPDAAADLVQEVLLMTLERLRNGQVREPERLASYVLGMCRLVVCDTRRKDRRHQRLLSQFADSVPVVDVSVTPIPDAERLSTCLEELKERDRTVIILAFGVEKATAEIAEELGVPSDHVRVIRHRALSRLRKCMEGKGKH
jgi:RNA polymerase sigma-70 factor (ECF subfamily)